VAASPKTGDTVDVVVSLGDQVEVPSQVTVPNVVGSTTAAATAAIEAVGLTATATTAYSTSVAIGKVISQTPAASATVDYGSAVAIVSSLGTLVPDVVGDSYPVAQALIEVAGLVYSATTENSTIVPAGNIISQSPTSGTLVSPGNTVSVVRSLGKDSASFNAVKSVADFLENALMLSAESGDTLHERIAMDRTPPDFENTTTALQVQEQSGAPQFALLPAMRRQIAVKCFGGTADFDGCCEVHERVKAVLHNQHGMNIMFAELVTSSRYYEPDTGWPVVLDVYQVETIGD
jgi:serine/threonine-protein kinase